MPKRRRSKIFIIKGGSAFFSALTIIFFLIAVVLLAGFSLFFYWIKDFPLPENFSEKQSIESTKIYDRTGKIILYNLYDEEKRTIVPLSEISDNLKKAVIATEDADFYRHKGISLKSIGRAVLADLKIKNLAQGGSTISQQLIRSAYLTKKKTIERKTKEIVLALELERRYPKDQILEFYLNQVSFGPNIYGAEEASLAYFGKRASVLSWEESASLAAMIKSPSYLNPYSGHKDELSERKNYILGRLTELGYLSQEESEKIKKKSVDFLPPPQPFKKAPHFVIYVLDALKKQYGFSDDYLKENGLKIYTTLDTELQEAAEKAVKEGVKNNEKSNAYNAGLVAVNPKNGEILAMVGSKNYFDPSLPKGCAVGKDCLFDPQVNMVLAPRQPGSSFKPFAYATAFNKGFSPETVLWDVEIDFGVKQNGEPYVPQNYDEKFRGPINIRNSLAQSLNVPSVKVLYLAGLEDTLKTAKELGITTLNQPPYYYGLSLVLGGGGVKLLEMTSAYGVFANDGQKTTTTPIIKIEDNKGNIIREFKSFPKKIISSQTARLINDVLSDNNARAPIFGDLSQMYFENYQVAAKTGTAQDYRDAFIIGYTPSIVTGVWVGNNNYSPMYKKAAVSAGGPMWHQFMEKALTKYPQENFLKPEAIQTSKPVINGKFVEKTGEDGKAYYEAHSILNYVDKNNPLGDPPKNPADDPQYAKWEEGIKKWLQLNPETGKSFIF